MLELVILISFQLSHFVIDIGVFGSIDFRTTFALWFVVHPAYSFQENSLSPTLTRRSGFPAIFSAQIISHLINHHLKNQNEK
jgi:hypothetical protein